MSKHTNDYINSIYVVQNPKKYDYSDVISANSFINSYNQGYHKKQGTTYRSDIDVYGTFWIETYNRVGELISKEHYYPNGEFKEEIFKEKNDNLKIMNQFELKAQFKEEFFDEFRFDQDFTILFERMTRGLTPYEAIEYLCKIKKELHISLKKAINYHNLSQNNNNP